jgi:hypothetical protein
MPTTPRLVLGVLVLSAALGCQAQATAPEAAASAPAAARSAAVAKVVVIEDAGVRIEETRLRGAAQRITVQSKLGGKEYEILVAPAGRDPTQERGAAGQRAWSLFTF